MSVDFFPCSHCFEAICDCGHYIICSEDCHRRWCGDLCAASDGFLKDYDGQPSCSYCRDERAEDAHLLKWALKKLKLTRKMAEKEMLSPLKSKRKKNK